MSNILSNIYNPSYKNAPVPESRFIISKNSTWNKYPAQCIIDQKLTNPYKGGTRVELVSPFGKIPASCTVFYKVNDKWCTCAAYYNGASSKYFGVIANCPGDGIVYVSSGDYTVSGQKLLSPNPTNSNSLTSAEIVIMLTPANIAADGVITFEVGNTETLPSGSNANVKNVGDGGRVVLDFSIPKGEMGSPGENAISAINPRGDYDVNASPSYTLSDYISFDGNSYVCKTDNPSNVAPTTGHNDDSFWQLIALEGARGPEGPPGEKGEQGIPGIPGDLVSGTAITPTTRFFVPEGTTWTKCPNQCIVSPKLKKPYPANWRANLTSPFGEVPGICTVFYKVGEKWVTSIEYYNADTSKYVGVVASCPGDGTIYVSSGDYLNSGGSGLAPNPSGANPQTALEIVIMVSPASSGILEVSGGGSSSGIGGNIYSSEEQVIGTWIDGKPLYRKCWHNIPHNENGELDVEISIADLDIEEVVRLDNLRVSSINVVGGQGSGGFITINMTKKMVSGTKLTSATIREGTYRLILIEYTKTTD